MLLSQAAFKQQAVRQAPPLPVAKRLEHCPTIPVYAKPWAKVTHVLAPGPDELVMFSASEEARSATAPEAVRQLGQQARSVIDANLLQTGSVLLQGLPITAPEACEAFVEGLGYSRQRYEPYGGTRQKIGSLDAATNVGPVELLDLHNEMCYNPRPNRKIMLVCLKPAKEGGESLIGDSAAIAAAMPDWVLKRFEDHGGVRYTRTYVSADAAPADPAAAAGPAKLTWQERTGLSDPEAAAGFFRDLGFSSVELQQPGDTLVARHTAPAVVPHPATGQPVWFNLTHLAAPSWTEYADGVPIEPETVEAIVEARLSATRTLQLAAGDVLVLDNYRCAHGRLPYDDSEGRTLVAVLTSD